MNGFGFGFSAALGTLLNYNPSSVDMALLTTERSGLALVDSLGGANPSILLPYLSKPLDTQYATYADGGALDVGNTDFTIFGWVKILDKSAFAKLFGKSINAAVSGSYGFSHTTNGYLECRVYTTGGEKVITSTIDGTLGWHFILMDINQTTKVLRLFIDNNQIGVDTSFTGTFNALNAVYKFRLGCSNTSSGLATQISKAAFYDIGILNRLLTPAEKTAAFSGTYPSDMKAMWDCSSYKLYDISGNNYHLTPTLIDKSNVKYGSNGSAIPLNRGYSLYNLYSSVEEIQIPLKANGTAVTAPTFEGVSELIGDFAGDLNNHNLADTLILFDGDDFDRSNTTIYNANARSGYYDAAMPKAWHVSELNRRTLDYMLNDNYRGKIFPKITTNSYNNRTLLTGIANSKVNKTGSDLTKILTWAGDTGKPAYRSIFSAGIALCFDDTQRSAGWKNADDVLTPSFTWKATFFLQNPFPSNGTNFNDYITYLQPLIANGHEIGNHSYNHVDWRTYLLTHTVDEFYTNEVVPMQTTIINALSVTPTTYGYAQVSGDDTELNAYLLSHGFTHVRPFRSITDYADFLYKISYYGLNDNIVWTLSLTDFFNTGTQGDTDILKILKLAKENNLILVLTGHSIDTTNASNSGLNIKLSRLQTICQYIIDNGMTFYRISDLQPSLFGL